MSLETYQSNKALIIKLEGIQHFIGGYPDLWHKEEERTGKEVGLVCQRGGDKNLWNGNKLIQRVLVLDLKKVICPFVIP